MSDLKQNNPSALETFKSLLKGNLDFRTRATLALASAAAKGDDEKAVVRLAFEVPINEASQHPHAAVAGCIDSRVIPEALFGQGIGKLFVARTAGSLCGHLNIGSLAFGMAWLDLAELI